MQFGPAARAQSEGGLTSVVLFEGFWKGAIAIISTYKVHAFCHRKLIALPHEVAERSGDILNAVE